MEMGRALIIAAAGMATVFAALAAMWLAMVILGRLPSKPTTEKTIPPSLPEETSLTQPEEKEVAAIAAALLQAQQEGVGHPGTRRPLSPWRALVRVSGANLKDRGDL